jgi:hypothetical protein
MSSEQRTARETLIGRLRERADWLNSMDLLLPEDVAIMREAADALAALRAAPAPERLYTQSELNEALQLVAERTIQNCQQGYIAAPAPEGETPAPCHPEQHDFSDGDGRCLRCGATKRDTWCFCPTPCDVPGGENCKRRTALRKAELAKAPASPGLTPLEQRVDQAVAYIAGAAAGRVCSCGHSRSVHFKAMGGCSTALCNCPHDEDTWDVQDRLEVKGFTVTPVQPPTHERVVERLAHVVNWTPHHQAHLQQAIRAAQAETLREASDKVRALVDHANGEGAKIALVIAADMLADAALTGGTAEP